VFIATFTIAQPITVPHIQPSSAQKDQVCKDATWTKGLRYTGLRYSGVMQPGRYNYAVRMLICGHKNVTHLRISVLWLPAVRHAVTSLTWFALWRQIEYLQFGPGSLREFFQAELVPKKEVGKKIQSVSMSGA